VSERLQEQTPDQSVPKAASPVRSEPESAAPVSGSLGELVLQAKLSVGPVNDPLEAEADRVANRIVRSFDNSRIDKTGEARSPGRIQRMERAAGGVGPAGPQAGVGRTPPNSRIQRASPMIIQREGGDDDGGASWYGNAWGGLMSMVGLGGAPDTIASDEGDSVKGAAPKKAAPIKTPVKEKLDATQVATAAGLREKLKALHENQHQSLFKDHGTNEAKRCAATRTALAKDLRQVEKLTSERFSELEKAAAEMLKEYPEAVKAAEDAKKKADEAQDAAGKAETARANQANLTFAATQKISLAAQAAVGNPQLYSQLDGLLGGDDEIISFCKLVAPGRLPSLLATFNKSQLTLLLNGVKDKGDALNKLCPRVKETGDVAELLKVPDLGPAEFRSLLGCYDTKKLKLAVTFVPNGKALNKLATTIDDETEFFRMLSEIAITGTAAEVVTALAAEEATGATEAGVETAKKYDESGLIAQKGTVIEWKPYGSIKGDGGKNEQESLTAAMVKLGKGELALRDNHRNRDGDLPGDKNVMGVYDEYLVKENIGDSSPGKRRLVVHKAKKWVYYTWTHYGDGGATPAFARVK
jgi:hypothetical protein